MRIAPWYQLMFPFVLFTACGGLEHDSTVPESIATKDTSLTLLKDKQKDIQCGDVVTDKFTDTSTAHGYTFKAIKDTQVTITFKSDSSASVGGGLVVFDSVTSQRVAQNSDQQGTISSTFHPRENGSYVIGVFPHSFTGEEVYSLRVSCELLTPNGLTRGQTDFSTWERRYRWWLRTNSVSRVREAMIPTGDSREVEEGDIYRIDSNRLFYLNT